MVSEDDRQEPTPQRLTLPRGYAAPNDARVLPWAHVTGRLERVENFWLATTRPDGRPHVTPLWGVWVRSMLYLDGIPTARWARNLAKNPAASVHLESGTDVVILDGTVEDVVTDAEIGAEIVAAWTAKYGRLEPEPATSGIFRFKPKKVRAWTSFPDDVTRWELA